MVTETAAKKSRGRGADARGGAIAHGGVPITGELARYRVTQILHRPVSEAVLARGLALHTLGLVKRMKNYPWKFVVSSPTSGRAYWVDLISGECGCEGWTSGKTCKHVVAAGAMFLSEGETD